MTLACLAGRLALVVAAGFVAVGCGKNKVSSSDSGAEHAPAEVAMDRGEAPVEARVEASMETGLEAAADSSIDAPEVLSDARADTSPEASSDAHADAAPEGSSDARADAPADVICGDLGCVPDRGSSCKADEVTWICNGPREDALFRAICRDPATNAPRYCCPASFLTMCRG